MNVNEICTLGNTFLWDLLVNNNDDDYNDDNLEDEDDEKETFVEKNEGEKISKTFNQVAASASSSNHSLTKHEQQSQTILRILKEAEKQLHTLLCLPSTDRRIRLKFIESCLNNLRANRSCLISLRLLIKLFGSFQQYSSTPPGNRSY